MRNEVNLLEETSRVLAIHGLTTNDIVWAGTRDTLIPLEDFIRLADVEYDQGYGTQEVAKDLLIVGNNWWLERNEYDGAEGWEYKAMPLRPKDLLRPESLVVTPEQIGWLTLAEINHAE